MLAILPRFANRASFFRTRQVESEDTRCKKNLTPRSRLASHSSMNAQPLEQARESAVGEDAAAGLQRAHSSVSFSQESRCTGRRRRERLAEWPAPHAFAKAVTFSGKPAPTSGAGDRSEAQVSAAS